MKLTVKMANLLILEEEEQLAKLINVRHLHLPPFSIVSSGAERLVFCVEKNVWGAAAASQGHAERRTERGAEFIYQIS